MTRIMEAAMAWLLACPLVSKPKFESSYARLDVINGRGRLASRLKKGEEVSVIIVARLQRDLQSQSEDAVSIEFGLDVDAIYEVKP